MAHSCYICCVCVCYAFFRACILLPCGRSPGGKGLTSWLSFVMSNGQFVIFPLVSCVGCGT